MLSLNNDVSKVILGRLYDWCQRRHKCGTYAAYESGYMYCMCTVSALHQSMTQVHKLLYQSLLLKASQKKKKKEIMKSNFVTENTSQILYTYASMINAICIMKPDCRNSSPKIEKLIYLYLVPNLYVFFNVFFVHGAQK